MQYVCLQRDKSSSWFLHKPECAQTSVRDQGCCLCDVYMIKLRLILHQSELKALNIKGRSTILFVCVVKIQIGRIHFVSKPWHNTTRLLPRNRAGEKFVPAYFATVSIPGPLNPSTVWKHIHCYFSRWTRAWQYVHVFLFVCFFIHRLELRTERRESQYCVNSPCIQTNMLCSAASCHR